jgi:hypothetical protein
MRLAYWPAPGGAFGTFTAIVLIVSALVAIYHTVATVEGLDATADAEAISATQAFTLFALMSRISAERSPIQNPFYFSLLRGIGITDTRFTQILNADEKSAATKFEILKKMTNGLPALPKNVRYPGVGDFVLTTDLKKSFALGGAGGRPAPVRGGAAAAAKSAAKGGAKSAAKAVSGVLKKKKK